MDSNHSVMPQGGVLGPLLFILYSSEMFELVENRLYAYADDSILLTVVHKPADRPVSASLKGTVPEVIQFLSFFYCV